MGLSSPKSAFCPPAQPLEFHPVHGDNVMLSQGNTIAARVESFCKAVVFTHRPVRVSEKIFIRFVEKSESWSGSIRFGFSAVDPRQLAGNLPKYACPDLTNKSGFWAKALSEKFSDKDSVMYYYVTNSGDVVFGVNGEDKGVFFSGVDTRRQLWGMVDVYGNSNVIELVDPRRTLNNIRAQTSGPRTPTPSQRSDSRRSDSDLSLQGYGEANLAGEYPQHRHQLQDITARGGLPGLLSIEVAPDRMCLSTPLPRWLQGVRQSSVTVMSS